MTQYVATRWYRAPEIMLDHKNYNRAIDVWSAGHILAEMLGGKALFPGKHYMDQLDLIFDVLGTPETEDREAIGSKRARKYIGELDFKPKIPLVRIFTKASIPALDLLGVLLAFNPAKCFTVEEPWSIIIYSHIMTLETSQQCLLYPRSSLASTNPWISAMWKNSRVRASTINFHRTGELMLLTQG